MALKEGIFVIGQLSCRRIVVWHIVIRRIVGRRNQTPKNPLNTILVHSEPTGPSQLIFFGQSKKQETLFDQIERLFSCIM